MTRDFRIIEKAYAALPERVAKAREILCRPLTLSEKILYAHLWPGAAIRPFARGQEYVEFAPDRVAMQDVTAQMALLQLMQAGDMQVAVPSTVHCDHLIVAKAGAKPDLAEALQTNEEVYAFLASASNKYGIEFWKPGAGIIHQVIFEHYAFPGGMMIGTDSHTPTAGGLGMIAVGVGGADAVDVMAAMPWELKVPKLIGVQLTGRLRGWTSPKDVILKLAGMLTVKGGTGCILEYFGDGAEAISCTGKGTICNMGAEVGATASVFPYDDSMRRFLKASGRADVTRAADAVCDHLRPDPEVCKEPDRFYDRVIHVDLDALEPHISGPFSPDIAWPLSKLAGAVCENGWPREVEVGLIGSCTNSSYEDLARSASIARQARAKGLKALGSLVISPGSELVRSTAERDGLLAALQSLGAVVMANACGPCIGQWIRRRSRPEAQNTIVTSFNRNFAKRNDGDPNTHAFVASPELVTAFALAGDLTFNPLTDTLTNDIGEQVRLDPPTGDELPAAGFEARDLGRVEPAADGGSVRIIIRRDSDRLQRLDPFPAWEGTDLKNLRLLMKIKGKCTTDHISPAGPWLRYRGHLDRISDNCFSGAVNAFTGETGTAKNQLTGAYDAAAQVQRAYKAQGIGSIVVGDENYGEGSSREHAAMEPRYLGVRAILAKSFARIHETNLKKQGMLALTFADSADYNKVREDDVVDILGLVEFAEGKSLTLVFHHVDGSVDRISANHSYNVGQIAWFRAGSALNTTRKRA